MGVRSVTVLATVTLLFWASGGIRVLATNCRPDLLNALCSLLTVGAAWLFVSERAATVRCRRAAALVVLGGAAVYSSGLQGCPYLLALAIVAIICFKAQRRDIVRGTVLAVIGMAVAFVAWGILAWSHGTLHWYLYRPVEYSATALRLLVCVLPLVGAATDHDFSGWIAGVEPRLHELTFTDKLTEAAQQCSGCAWLYVVVAVLLLLRLVIAGHRSVTRGEWFIILWTVAAPVVMLLAGRMRWYYVWTLCIPALMAVGLMAQRLGRRLRCLAATVATVGCVMGLNSRPAFNESAAIRQCIQKAGVRKTDYVAASYSSFYDVRDLSEHCFFVQTYGTRLPQRPDIIVVDYGDDYNTVATRRVLDETRAGGHVVMLVSRCKRPKLEVYRVSR